MSPGAASEKPDPEGEGKAAGEAVLDPAEPEGRVALILSPIL